MNAAGRKNLPVTARDGACGVTRGREETLRMLSIPDMALLGAAALMFFGPEQLPKVARKVGLLVRDVQNTSQTFIREMERAADESAGGADVARAHLLDEHAATTYGAYDGGYVASPLQHDIPKDEVPPLDVAAQPHDAEAHVPELHAHDVPATEPHTPEPHAQDVSSAEPGAR
jgi:Sec-independent protein translocase protein TatA